MKLGKIHTLFLVVFFVWSNVQAQQITFSRYYGGSLDELGFDVCPVSSGGYALIGWTQSYGSGSADYYLVRTDDNGTVIWTKTYGASGSESGLSIAATADGGFILGGTTRTYGAGLGDFWLVKTDPSGNVQWSKTYGGSADDYMRQLKQTSDGGYILAGHSDSYSNGGRDIYMIKTDAGGNTVWAKNYGGAADEEGWTVDVTSDGGYVVGGWTKSYGNGMADFYLIKTDAGGNVTWTKTYGGNSSDSGTDVKQAGDGGYLFAGTTRTYGNGLGDIWLVKTDPDGNLSWSKTYGGPEDDYGRGICIGQHGYGVCGYVTSFGQSDLHVILTDFSGNQTHEFTCGESGADEGWRIRYANGSFLAMGQGYTNGTNDMLFVKISERKPSDIPDYSSEAFMLYPNPAEDRISVKGEFSAHAGVRIIDMSGKKVLEHPAVFPLDISGLQSGVYVVEIYDDGKKYTEKFVKR